MSNPRVLSRDCSISEVMQHWTRMTALHGRPDLKVTLTSLGRSLIAVIIYLQILLAIPTTNDYKLTVHFKMEN